VIGESCFDCCGSLASITFETGSPLTRFDSQAFCESRLISIHLPASVAVIGESCFRGCRSLVLITIETGSQLSELAKEAFRGNVVILIHLPASVTVIGESCFSGCRLLASITFDPVSEFRANERDLLAGLPQRQRHFWMTNPESNSTSRENLDLLSIDLKE
jgi:hypothetical protein